MPTRCPKVTKTASVGRQNGSGPTFKIQPKLSASMFAIAWQDIFSRIAPILFQPLKAKTKATRPSRDASYNDPLFLSYTPFLIYFIKFRMLF